MLDVANLTRLKDSLYAGRYNLLLGTGVSLDSTDRNGKPVLGADDLRKLLNKLRGLKETTLLSRVCQVLTDGERREHLTERYLGCRPGPTVSRLTRFVWKQTFTLNIDDALESAYQVNEQRKQSPVPFNYDAPYETLSSRHSLPIVHLHGFVREPEKNYVFSLSEYAKATRGLNAWMHVLSQLLASEPFIVAGTSLNESDLEYFLAERTPTSSRTDLGPSILVEPNPDAVTFKDCERHGLVLVKATLNEFLQWLEKQLGSPPNLTALTVPTIEKLFAPEPDKIRQVGFFSAFSLVQPIQPSAVAPMPSPFYYGRPPTWNDLSVSVDIPLDDELRLANKVRSFLDGNGAASTILVAIAEAGTGKTTDIRRVAYDLARDGRIVFSLRAQAPIDLDNAVACLKYVNSRYVILIDGLAEYVQAVRSLLEHEQLQIPFIVLAAERNYRQEHLDRVLGDLSIEYLELSRWADEENLQLIERYRKNGLLGSSGALKDPKYFAIQLRDDPIAVSVCRVLNDFKPLERILRSVWNHANEASRRSYVITALAYFCHPSGLFYPILQTAQENPGLPQQLSNVHPLPLVYSQDSDDYVLPLNPVIAERMLNLISRDKGDILLEAFVKLGNALAPYVNIRTIIHQTAEARMQRLFDADKVVRPLLGDNAESFYIAVKARWEWNSRYWEQRALLIRDADLTTAIQYARHAVAIEPHPFPWTTLAGLLIKKMDSETLGREALFLEAFEYLEKAIESEMSRARRLAPHAFAAVFHGARNFLNAGGSLTGRQRQSLERWISDAKHAFKRDKKIQSACENLESQLLAAK